MPSNEAVYVTLEFTPNPNTLKYMVNRAVVEGTLNFENAAQATKDSPLAAQLFGIAGITGVMLGRDFVTITKDDSGDWDDVHQKASQLIETHLGEGKPVLSENVKLGGNRAASTEAEKKIVEILDNEIRPAVAKDGGDITFDRYQDGVVYLYLQGSCAGCPSSTMTLKVGIENRLKEVLPEIKEVVSV